MLGKIVEKVLFQDRVTFRIKLLMLMMDQLVSEKSS